MTDGPGLLRSVLEHPEDDARRLVYADWLDEHGRAWRAALIRYQCNSLSYDPDWTLFVPGPDGERQWRWEPDDFKPAALSVDLPALEELPLPEPLCSVTFRRGFIEEVQCPAAWWLGVADSLTAAHPIREVRLTTWPNVEWQPPTWEEGGHWLVIGDPAWKPVYCPVSPLSELPQITNSLVMQARWPGVTFHLPPGP